jgi:hypothetical protein
MMRIESTKEKSCEPLSLSKLHISVNQYRIDCLAQTTPPESQTDPAEVRPEV